MVDACKNEMKNIVVEPTKVYLRVGRASVIKIQKLRDSREKQRVCQSISEVPAMPPP